MRRMVRWSLVAVLVIDVVVVAAFLAGGPPLRAAGQPAAGAASGDDAADAGTTLTAESLRALGEQLRARQAALERREAELEELLRAEAVLARAGIVAPAGPDVEQLAAAEAAATERQAAADRRRTAFASLAKAYENMEPDSAANALAQLAQRDRAAVIELLLGWQPRTSGAILDALTRTDAALAAQLSYEIWAMDGNAPAGGDG